MISLNVFDIGEDSCDFECNYLATQESIAFDNS
jgi:hypothetical protein